jgi:hypothetical protein
MKSLQERIQADPPSTSSVVLSPAYTYNQITQGICEGTELAPTLQILKEQGTISLSNFPYFDDSCNTQPTTLQIDQAAVNKISDYKYLSGINMVDEMKTLIIDEKPIIIAAFLSSKFALEDSLGLTAYREHTINYNVRGSCHAMLVVGYSDEFNAFKVVNSWGEGWGDDGYVWIDYAAFENVSDPTADFRVISTALVAYDL